jgi:hypothetical protein
MFVGITPQHERDISAAEIAGMLNGKFSEIQDGLAFALLPPPVLGLGNSAGVETYVQDRSAAGYGELNNQVQALSRGAARHAGFRSLRCSPAFQANVPQLDASVDRIKAKEQGLALTEIYDRAAGLPGLRLRQRLQPVRAHLQRLRAGRCGLPRPGRGHLADQGAQRGRADGADRLAGRSDAELRPRSGGALQRLSGGRPAGRHQPGADVQPAGHRQIKTMAPACCRRACRSNGPG